MKIKFVGTLSNKEAKELLAFEGLEKMFKALNLPLSADICRQIFEMADEYNEPAEYTKDFFGEDHTANIKSVKDKIYSVGKSQICKGSTIGSCKILKGSYIAAPRPSLARNIREVYDQWHSNGIIEEDGKLTQDMEVTSRNVAVGLALGYSASANNYIPETLWK